MRLPVAVLASCCLMTACDSPHPMSDFAAVKPTEIEVDGRRFSVRVAGTRATAVRWNFEWGAKAADVLPSAGLAIERVSGCRVVPGSLTGDVALIEARLDC